MPSVVFLRAVNLGGKRLKTKDFAAQLGYQNVGAAGTFASPDSVRATESAVRGALPFDTPVIVRPASALRKLVADDPFADYPSAPGRKPFVSVLASKPKVDAAVPLSLPAKGAWDLRVLACLDRWVLCLRRPGGEFYPNEVVEQTYRVDATTRGWDTLVKLAAKL